MEKYLPIQQVKYYELFDILILADSNKLAICFNAFKKGTERVIKKYTMEGSIKAFEMVPAKSDMSGNVWLSVILDLTEPTYYIWNFEANIYTNTLKEISKIEIGHYHFCGLFCPPQLTIKDGPSSQMQEHLSLRLFLVSSEVLYLLTLPSSSAGKKYKLEALSDHPNPNGIFDAVGSKYITAGPSTIELRQLDKDSPLLDIGKKSEIGFVKLSRGGRLAAIANSGVGKGHSGN